MTHGVALRDLQRLWVTHGVTAGRVGDAGWQWVTLRAVGDAGGGTEGRTVTPVALGDTGRDTG